MQIVEGLFDNMVMQRSAKGFCDQVVTGTSKISGQIFYRVKKGKRYKSWLKAGRCNNGKWSIKIKDLPVGGPYDIQLKLQSHEGDIESITVNNVLVGDAWVLAGQSNMEGYGYLRASIDLEDNIRNFYMDNTWSVASDPLHNIYEAFDEVHRNLVGINPAKRNKSKGAAPGLHFARKMYEYTKVPQGLIACAHGGTSMEQWDPKKKKSGSNSLYGAMLRRINHNGGKVAGVVWYQGCSEANEQYHAFYTKSMVKFVDSIRKDLSSPSLPFVMAQISRTTGLRSRNSENWNSIQQQQRLLPDKISRLAVVSAIDSTLDDAIHLDEDSQIRVGNRMAQAALSISDRNFKKFKPIDFKDIKIFKDKDGRFADIRVSFKNVIGGLASDSRRPEGFSIVDKDKLRRDAIYKTVLKNNYAILKTDIPFSEIGNYKLFYGFGCNPYCNITDTQDRSLPVFGPVLLGKPRPITDFARQFYLSKAFTSDKYIDVPDLKNKAFGWEKITFEDNFCNIHDRFVRHQGKNIRYYFGCKVVCPKQMSLNIYLGYDGPVRLWVDGKNLFENANGTNPANTNDSIVPCRLSKGEHQVIISLDSNNGSAYGIFLRLERCGIPSGKTIDKLTDQDWPVIKI